jgi:hypothetical protein
MTEVMCCVDAERPMCNQLRRQSLSTERTECHMLKRNNIPKIPDYEVIVVVLWELLRTALLQAWG